MIEVYEMIYAILGDDPSMLNFYNLDSALLVLLSTNQLSICLPIVNLSRDGL